MKNWDELGALGADEEIISDLTFVIQPHKISAVQFRMSTSYYAYEITRGTCFNQAAVTTAQHLLNLNAKFARLGLPVYP